MSENITISEALGWQKTLQTRHRELVDLRNQNSTRETRFYGANVDKEKIVDPVYDVVELDRTINQVAREMRKLDEAVKRTNMKTTLDGYARDEAVLGELKPALKHAFE